MACNFFLFKRLTISLSFSLITGTVIFVFTAIGVLLSGAVISKYKPSARTLALWNVIVGYLSVVGFLSYAFLGCSESENSIIVNHPFS